ncbi:UbiD family decarboxylase [Gordonia bronchialis]|uniref:UbiD family decarboxylase n=1 Tax=Gordonia bronchialis TaxID=2054 RepID=UPI00226E1DD7|nr:UbiD family decarboxylase [Gordonia bronchialis]
MNTPAPKAPIKDLREGIELLKQQPGQFVSTDVEVDPQAELAGVYRKVGAGGTVTRPTQVGPAMLIENVKGYDIPVIVGVLASRTRIATFLGADEKRLGQHMLNAMEHAQEPEVVESAPCQEIVYHADDPDFDIRTLLPAPTNTPEDAGPYFCMAVLRGTDPDTGQHDVTIHRLCVQGRDEISVFMQTGRHIGVMYDKYDAMDKPMPITISMGISPVEYMAISFEPPSTPYGFDELEFAGGLKGSPVELVKAVTIDEMALASAEIVIEGEIQPKIRVAEDQHTNTGFAMPEFPGYDGVANPSLPVIKVKAVTTRRDPILQTLVGPGEEHVSLAGIPTEGSLTQALDNALPGLVTNMYAHSAGGGKYLGILQIHKRDHNDQGRERQAAIVAFGAFPEMKHIILVDDDVDIFDTDDVLWAMTTRFQAERSVIPIPGVRCHPLDPSADPDFLWTNFAHGISTKVIFDCTVPWALRDKFIRAPFQDVDVTKFLPDWPDDRT